ncbi:MAG TPA: hypothetical protein VMZ03_04295 [Chitinophagaceae bacterium]|nr:hypothetical protein [Chitinophagaceae bacterium]
MNKHSFLIILFLAMCFIPCKAQTDSGQVRQNKASFKLGVYYNSGLNYYGRTDSLQSSAVFPVAELWVNKHVYITAAPVFVSNNAVSFEYAGSVATLGYRFGKDNKWAGNLYLVKPIYRGRSQLVQSALKAQAVGTYTWITKILNITAGGDIKLSDNLDYGATAGLDHIIRFELSKGSVLVFDPSALINAGTQQFTKTSYKQSGFLIFPGAQQQVTEEVSKFNILSYEFSMPVVLTKGKLQLIANPAYVIPQHLITVPGRPDLSERGKEMFYVTVGAKVSF